MKDFWKAVGIVCVVLAVGGIITGIIFGIRVAVSPATGKGNVVIKNNDATNRINSQAYFQDLYGDIQSYQAQLPDFIQQYEADPSDSIAYTNYNGMHAQCVNAVTEYNAASGKTLFQDWKSADLPQTIDITSTCPSAHLSSATPRS